MKEGEALVLRKSPEGQTDHEIPLVLAGPILRRVEESGVSVWLALREQRTVTLEVWSESISINAKEAPENVEFRGSAESVAVGENLHLVLVTASPLEGTDIDDSLYLYDLKFGDNASLVTEGVLSYEQAPADRLATINMTNEDPGRPFLPSFYFSPTEDTLNKLRILYGSCRTPHARGKDGLTAAFSALKGDRFYDDEKRPNHLILGGDQIYADIVADCFLSMLTSHGIQLLGEEEETPAEERISSYRPGRRRAYAGNEANLTLTAPNGKSHLLSFGEYCAMYCCVWSDVLWPQSIHVLPEFEDVYPPDEWEERETAGLGGSERLGITLPERGEPTLDSISSDFNTVDSIRSEFNDERAHLADFLDGLPDVRRALAHIPTLMVLDDHDIVDDWNFSGRWVEDVTEDNDDGEWILQNAITAATLFQAWGNTPSRFEGEDLEDFVESRGSMEVNPLENRDEETRDVKRTLHFDINYGDYEIIALDTRTLRGYGSTDDPTHDPPELIAEGELERQIGWQPDSTIVSFIVNPCPAWPHPAAELAQEKATDMRAVQKRVLQDIYGYDLVLPEPYKDNEHWIQQPSALHRLISYIAVRGGAVGNQIQTRTILLSGDVHHAFSAKVDFEANRTPMLDPPSGIKASIASLASSAMKNVTIEHALLLHAAGLEAERIRGAIPEPNSGDALWEEDFWADFPENALMSLPGIAERVEAIREGLYWRERPDHVGFILSEHAAFDRGGSGFEAWIDEQEWDYKDEDFCFVEAVEIAENTQFEPDWVYKVDYLEGARDDSLADVGPDNPWLDALLEDDAWGRDVVARNNLGEVALTWDEADDHLEIEHRLWWRERAADGIEPRPLTSWYISLNPQEIDRGLFIPYTPPEDSPNNNDDEEVEG